MNKKIIMIAILAVVVLGGGVLALTMISANKTASNTQTTPSETEEATMEKDKEAKEGFTAQSFQNIKTPHFVSSNPSNNQLLTAPLSQVTVSFNFDVAEPSKISVTRGGVSVTTGGTVISDDKLSLSVPVSADRTGNYEVKYTACWADKSCHDGNYGFSVKLVQ